MDCLSAGSIWTETTLGTGLRLAFAAIEHRFARRDPDFDAGV
jgi:hypothetical protein